MIRIAASTYLNSAPLVHSFAQGHFGERYDFIGDAAPSRCAAMLADGECEIALIPVIEYQRIPDLRIIPGVAVASKNRVRSVILVTREKGLPISEVKRVALDTSSRSSQALVRILFRESYGVEPEYEERRPDPRSGYENMLKSTDAALIIGDPAMQISSVATRLGIGIYDLASEWRRMTESPFVFALWALRGDLTGERGLVRDFQLARDKGLSRLEEIATGYAADLELPATDLLDYLRNNVNYDLDAENLTGMRRYYELAHRHGLIAEERPLLFLENL